jgi:hypothetical protein
MITSAVTTSMAATRAEPVASVQRLEAVSS